MKKTWMMLMMLSAISFAACESEEGEARDAADDQHDAVEDANEDMGMPNWDADWVNDAVSRGMLEMELSRMAQTMATNADVKKFADMAVKDHMTMSDEIKAYAASKNIMLPTVMDAGEMRKLDDIKGKTGMDFDKEYVKLMEDLHDTEVREFKRAADDARDPDLKAWAAKSMPTITMHEQEIDRLKDMIK